MRERPPLSALNPTLLQRWSVAARQLLAQPSRRAPAYARFAGAFGVAAVFIFGLFWLLHALISGGGAGVDKPETLPTIDFVRLNKAFEVETRERKPPKPPDRPEAPPETPTPQAEVQAPAPTDVDIGSMSVDNTTSVKSGIGLAAGEGEYLPIVKVSPIYPARAQQRGIEGWVLLEFTVTEIGSVKDPVVIEAEPTGIFDDAAKKAVLKFKYKPRVENGVAVAVPKVQHLISFKIEK